MSQQYYVSVAKSSLGHKGMIYLAVVIYEIDKGQGPQIKEEIWENSFFIFRLAHMYYTCESSVSLYFRMWQAILFFNFTENIWFKKQWV